MLNKFLERITRFCRYLMSDDFKGNHKYQNKNQITNRYIVLNLLKNKNFIPGNIVDVGCGYGEWTKLMLKYYPYSKYYLFDANIENEKYLDDLCKSKENLNYKICLLSDNINEYKFFSMGTGSSIYEENTNHPRKVQNLMSTTLKKELPTKLFNSKNNLIKLDVQGSELKILEGLNSFDCFEVIILEVSLHEYNKGAPLFIDIINYMREKNYVLYDLFDFKRLGNQNSYLLQFDCIFVRQNSDLLQVNF